MFDTLRDILYECYCRALPYKEVCLHYLSRALIIIALALVAEVGVFNFNHFASSDYNTIDVTDKLEGQLQPALDGGYYITAINHTVEIPDLNTELHDVWIDFDPTQSAQVIDVKVQFTDSAHQTYFDSTEYSVGVPTVQVATNVLSSKYLKLHTSGYTDNLKIEFSGEEVTYPVKIDNLLLNAQFPFQFDVRRFLLAVLVLTLVYLFRPKSSVYRWYLRDHPGRSKFFVAFAVAFQIYLLSAFMLFGSSLVGVASSSYNSGSWDRHSIVNTFEVGGDNAQQYAELAKAMADGQLYLETEPPEWLTEMDDPYDKGARDELQKQTGEEYLFDVAYHDGHYYVYFGVVPVLLLYLPFYLLTGASFPTAIGVLLACIAFIIGITMLLLRFARHHFDRMSLGLFLLLQVPLVFCSGILYLLKFPTFYALPIMMALAFSVWGLLFWMKGRESQKPCGWYVAGSLCMALVFGCRPQLMVLSLVAFPLFWRSFIGRRRLWTAEGAKEFACLIAPYVIVIGGLMLYNVARFGSPLNFGANYNLTMNDMTQRGFDLGRLAPALFAFFLQTPATTGVFPYLQPVDFATTYLGQTIREVTFGGILACLPMLWILFFSVPILRMRVSERKTHTVTGVVVVMVFMGLVVSLLDAEMAGILQRYYADFSFLFIAAVVLLVFICNENLVQHARSWNLMLKVLIVLVTLSVLYSLLVCFIPETGWVSDVYPWAYLEMREMFEFWA